MTPERHIDVIIPALNEAPSIGDVLRGIPSQVRTVYVADNGSTDETAAIAAGLGATVVHEPRRGYGAACLAALARLSANPPDIVVFMDADGSDLPEEMESLLAPIRAGEADLVIGSRVLDPGTAQPGSLSAPQRFGNALATLLIRRLWKIRCTDLGPFRAIRYAALRELAMDDLDYGWTVQMQARAAKHGLRIVEIPVSYRRRIGRSKISGTIRGVVGAGTKILTTIATEAARQDRWHGHSARAGSRGQHARTTARLIIFSRVPKAGTTKTRLIPALGEEGAAQLHGEMTRHTLDLAREWARQYDGHGGIEVRFTGGTAQDMADRFGCSTGAEGRYVAQGDGDLGDRLTAAFDDAFAEGMSHAIAIGCDCPDLTPELIDEAVARLRDHDLVLGPAHDGGYYLIGMNRSWPDLFRAIDWGGERVLSQTSRKAEDQGLTVATLEELGDVDEPEDLQRWHRHSRAGGRPAGMDSPHGSTACDAVTGQPRVSIIIPTLNESEHLSVTIAAARQSQHLEIIVVDGGSVDGTPGLAESLGARMIASASPAHRAGRASGGGSESGAAAKGRAAQMNLGARHARSDVLLFLHADTRLPFGYLDDVERIRGATGGVGLAFRLAFDTASPSLRLIEGGANLRSRWRGLPYGDQALVIRRDTFERLGGFREVPVMEDYEFIRRLRKSGEVRLSRRAAVTSARRWLRGGVWRTTMRHQMAILAYSLGVSIDRIAMFLGRGTGQVRQAESVESTHLKEESAYASASDR